MPVQLVFAACAPGLEPVLAAELSALGLSARATAGGVEASGEDAVARACVGSRVADAVALRLFSGPEEGVATAIREARRTFGGHARLAVRRDAAAVTVSIDAAGEPLYRRGWRARIGAAPLRESLAAGMLLLGGYDGGRPFLDPMCGSGTLAIEAAEIAARRAPGRHRRFAFERWPGHDPDRTRAVRADLARRERVPPAPIHASDRNAGALRLAMKNAAAAGWDGLIRFERADAARVAPPPGPGLLASNPPFGVRLSHDVPSSWRSLSELLARLPGWTSVLLAPDRELDRLLPVRPGRIVRVRNGPLACRILVRSE